MLEESSRFALKHADDLSYSCTFNTGLSMPECGEKMTAVVSPQRDGAKVNVSVAAKIGGSTVWRGSKNAKNLNTLFGSVSKYLQSHVRKQSWSSGCTPQFQALVQCTGHRQVEAAGEEGPHPRLRQEKAWDEYGTPGKPPATRSTGRPLSASGTCPSKVNRQPTPAGLFPRLPALFSRAM